MRPLGRVHSASKRRARVLARLRSLWLTTRELADLTHGDLAMARNDLAALHGWRLVRRRKRGAFWEYAVGAA